MNRILWAAITVFVTMLLGCALSYASPRHRHQILFHHRSAYSYDQGQIVAHPAGCPWSQFCGCGASVEIFGHPIRDLFLAWNWAVKFPRTYPHARAAAVWRHHVAVLLSGEDGGTALAYDANSGGHLTRVHRISLAGAVIVQP